MNNLKNDNFSIFLLVNKNLVHKGDHDPVVLPHRIEYSSINVIQES